jgi:hypothetical protein
MLNSCSAQEVPAQEKVKENLVPMLQKWHEGYQGHCHPMPDTTEENTCKQKTIHFDW